MSQPPEEPADGAGDGTPDEPVGGRHYGPASQPTGGAPDGPASQPTGGAPDGLAPQPAGGAPDGPAPEPAGGAADQPGTAPDSEIERDHYERTYPAYRRLIDAERFVAGALLLVVFALIIFQVFTRYVLGNPLSWSEELARLLVVWLTFVSAGFVASRNAHIAVDILAVYLPRRLATASQIFAMVLVTAGSLYMVFAAVSLMILTGSLTLPATTLPTPLLYGAVLVGYLMILGHTVLNIVLYLRHPAEIPDAVDKAAAMEGL